MVHAVLFALYLLPDLDVGAKDMTAYRELAIQLMSGRYHQWDVPYADPVWYPTPGYPLFIALGYSAFGVSNVAVVGMQVLLLGLICVLAFVLASDLFSKRIGYIAALLVATYSPLAFYASLTLSELLAALLLVLLVMAVRAGLRESSPWRWAFIGALGGYLVLVRPAFQALMIAVVILAFSWERARAPLIARVRRVALMTGASSVLILPWLIFVSVNFGQAGILVEPPGHAVLLGTWSRAFDDRVFSVLTELVSSEDELSDEELRRVLMPYVTDFSLGGAPSLSRFLRGSDYSAPQYLDDAVRYVRQWQRHYAIQRQARGRFGPDRLMVYREASAADLEAAIENVRREPARYLKSKLIESPSIWFMNTPLRSDHLGLVPAAARLAYWGYQAVLVALAVVGMVRAFRTNKAGFALLAGPVAVISLGYLPFQPDPRFMIPGQPLMLVLAAVGIDYAISRARAPSARSSDAVA